MRALFSLKQSHALVKCHVARRVYKEDDAHLVLLDYSDSYKKKRGRLILKGFFFNYDIFSLKLDKMEEAQW